MPDSNTNDAGASASAVEQSFNQSATEPVVASGTSGNVSATASAEIQVIQEAEQVLAQHNDRWRQMSDRLSNRPTVAPSLDMDGGSHRSIAHEYTEYRRKWDAQKNAIEAGAMMAIADVRANGTTLTKEFSVAEENENDSPNMAAEQSEPAPMSDTTTQFQREFSATASDLSRSNDR